MFSDILIFGNPFSFNFLWGCRACGAQFESCWEFGEEERLCNQRGTTTHLRCHTDSDLQIVVYFIIHVCLSFFQISVQLTKVLLHIEDKYSINGFLGLRQAVMVALTVTDCIPVWSLTCFSTVCLLSPKLSTHYLKYISLCSLVGDWIFDHRVLLPELQPSSATRYFGGENNCFLIFLKCLCLTKKLF